MSANIALLQAGAGSASQLLANGSDIAGAGGEPTSAGPFAALFQQLLSQQSILDLGNPLTLQSADAAIPAEDEKDSEQLAALLPFLEAMGLASPPQQAIAQMQETSSSPDSNGRPAAATTVIPAAQNGATANSAVQTETQESGTALPGDVEQASITAAEATTGEGETSLPAVRSLDEAASQNGSDFKAQLNTALQNGQENTNINGQHTQMQGSHGPAQSDRVASPMPLAVNQAVGGKGWSEEVGNHVVWMANRQESRAELVLTPPQMGRVEVSLAVSGDQATATFVSANPAVRDALETALPRLREILADAGIQLGQAQVGAESFQQSQQNTQQTKNGDNFGTGGNPAYGNLPQQAVAGDNAVASSLKMGQGLVDVFA